MVCLRCYKYTIDKTCRCSRESQRYHQTVLVDICCYHMRLFRQLCRASHYTVLSVFNLCYHTGIVRCFHNKGHSVAYSNWIGAFISFHSKAPPKSAIVCLSFGTKHLVPATCCFYYKAFHYVSCISILLFQSIGVFCYETSPRFCFSFSWFTNHSYLGNVFLQEMTISHCQSICSI